MQNVNRTFQGPGPRRAVFIILWLAFASFAWAVPLTVTGSSGSLESTLKFEMVGGQLWITLSNASETGAFYPTDMLGGAFFDIANDPILTPLWARVDTDSCLIYPGDTGCSSPATNPGPAETANQNIGGEWAYHRYASGDPISQGYGIGAVGLGFFGPADRFDSTQNLGAQSAIGGGNFSLAPKGGIPTPATGTVNGGLVNNAPYIMSSAVFAFTAPANFDPSLAIRNVRFQYGTSFSETSILADPVPEPITLAMIGGGLIALGILRRRAVR